MFASLFTATMTSSLHCANKHCGFVSVTPNEYSILTLHFPNSDGLCTLEDLLQNFVAQEPLIGNNVAYCRLCGQKSASSKALALATTPAVLLVHLKRFHSNGRRLNNAVSFPLQGLRLTNSWLRYSSNKHLRLCRNFKSLRRSLFYSGTARSKKFMVLYQRHRDFGCTSRAANKFAEHACLSAILYSTNFLHFPIAHPAFTKTNLRPHEYYSE